MKSDCHHNPMSPITDELTELPVVQHIRADGPDGLEAIELQLAGIIHSAMDAIITVDEQQHIVIFNAAAEGMFQCSAHDVIGTSLERFIPMRYRSAHHAHIQTFGDTCVTNRRMGALGSISGLRANGEEFPIEASISQVSVDGKRLFTVILRDISDRRKTERMAELGTLASGMAHEIGTPMNVILSRAEYLMRKTSDDLIKKGLFSIVTQVERITKIMNQLLSFARKRPMERRVTDLKCVIENVFDVTHERLAGQNIQVKVKGQTREVFADSDQLSQVFLNLVMNACYAMPDGGMISAIIQPLDRQVCVTISDTGKGIAEENVVKLFDPFFTTKPVGEGTGLGLTVVHGIIQEHDGVIQVESELGKGTAFHIFLPICKL
ncbi:two-component system sensor histidine kinase NtrB [Nitrospira sp. M1]